ncbi:MAG: hypothetical protein FJX64_10295, partial [Alphaproteobacteria bacterium]|nr:hypothetical protein [Alphaproteobacteria bacterium]
PAPQDAIGALLVRGSGAVTVGNRFFYLLGVEGLDEDSTCERDGGTYACGIVAMARLAEIVNGRVLHCALQQFPGDSRTWGMCKPFDPATRGPVLLATTLNQEWVRSGWARAHTLHTDAYAADERAARDAKLGIWAGAPPRSQRTDATVASGPVRVLDGNTILVDGIKVRLDSIDAPELGQQCRAQGRAYDCGELARGFLIDQVMGKRIHCTLFRREGDDRAYGHCRDADQPEAIPLNERMIRAGWAMAERGITPRYAPLEAQASRERRGMWAGQFVAPARWRQGER